jgi:hypothetical protein
MRGKRRWLKLAGEDWGNVEMFWEAIPPIPLPPPARKNAFFQWIVELHQTVSDALGGKPHRQLRAEAQALLKEANRFIAKDEWPRAVPLLEKAAERDPDRYEIAYRWALAVRNTSNDQTTANVVNRILQQSQWTGHETEMLRQLTKPGGR